MSTRFPSLERNLRRSSLEMVLWWSCLCGWLWLASSAWGQEFPTRPQPGFLTNAVAEHGTTREVVPPTEHDPITISAEYLHEETPASVDISARLAGSSGMPGVSREEPQGPDSERVFVLRDRCRIRQGRWELTARQMVVWRSFTTHQGRTVEKVLVYPEGDVRVTSAGERSETPADKVFIELYSSVGVTMEARHNEPGHVSDGTVDPLHQRALSSRGKVQQLAWNQPALLAPGKSRPLVGPEIDFDSLVPEVRPLATRHLMISPRSFGVGFSVSSFLSEETSPAEQVTVITQGVNIVVDGVPGVQGFDTLGPQSGTVDISADQVVIWTQADASGKFSPEMFQDANAPLQLYLEGNIEIRQGDNVMKASKAFYDVREDRAVLLDGELRVFVPDLEGTLKLRAEKIRQLSHDSYHAQNAWVTGSDFGVPTYRMEAGDIFLENRYDRNWIGRGDRSLDPQTGLSTPRATPWITSLDNRFRVGNTPVFMSPFLSMPAEDPHVPLESITFGGDQIFGAQVKTVWNMSKLLGLATPNADWNMQMNAYSERGVWLGNDIYYGAGRPGEVGSYYGEGEATWINDYGRDNLGLDRRSLDVRNRTRGRVLWRHREQINSDLDWTAEVGLLSDRNFLEQYYENEFDRGKDNETLIGLNRIRDNTSASLMTRFQVNDFEYDTQWLPRGDFTILGEPLWGDWLLYSSRTSAGYGQLRPARAPDDPTDLFVPLWYMPAAEGGVFNSRHEVSLPFSLGPVKFDPYMMGEAAFWQDDGFTNSSLQRFYGSAGVRGNVQLWQVFPNVRSPMLGLNGLAHKQTLGFDYYYADSSESLENIPQYNEFEENAQERFRTRLIFNTFGLMNTAMLPGQFDPRNYALRSGAARNVSSPYFELVDSQHVLRLNWNHRLQTKVGPPERQRIKDWMTLDLGVSYFPNPGDDNFGSSFGLLTANYMWDVGSRTKILANGQFDFFDEAPQVWDVGFLSQRSTRGSVYLGYRNIQAGPLLDSQLLTGSLSYAMSEKWIASLGTAYDIAERQDRGQSLTLTSVRSDVLIHIGMSIDASKGNWGMGFMIEPRLGPMNASSNQLSSLLGTRTQP